MRQVTVLRRLADHPAPTPQSTPCRLWQGATHAGYGYKMVGPAGSRRKQSVHRWVWEQVHGPIPKGMFILHRCDQPLCYRLGHLFMGTQKDNMADCSTKGRARGGGSKRRETCRRGGHPLSEAPNGKRYCRECLAEQRRERRAAKP